MGTVVPLIASVHDASGPVLAGQVSFFDGQVKIGAVPIVRVATAGYTPGTATLPRILGPGTHTLHATFQGTVTDQGSSSASSSLTVMNASSTPGPSLVYSNSRYLNQLSRLEKFILVDIDNDGVLDLVAPQFGFTNIAISLGDPTHPGAFLPPTFPAVPLSSGNDAVAAGDLNGDGLPDLVVSDSDNHLAVLLLQDPAHPGTFLPAINVGATQSDAQIADINHDGVPDIILFPSTSGQFTSSSISVVLGSPSNPGTFLPPTMTSLTSLGDDDTRSPAIADMNGDGLPDIVLANYSKQTVAILLNDPANPGRFLSRNDYPAGPNYSLAVGDLNNDGRVDVVLGGLFSGVTVLLGDPAHPGQLLAPVSYPVSATPAGGRSLGVAIGDVDGDGALDVVSGNFGPVFDLLLGRGDGTLRPTTSYATGPTPDTFEAVSISVADVDGDGTADVLVGQFYQNDVQTFLHQASSPQRLLTATDVVTASVVQVGHPLTIDLKVSSSAGPPPGSVTLYDTFGGATYTLIATLPLDTSGSATYTEASPALGFHDFLVHFPGDDLYSPSTSLITQVVVIPGPTISLSLTAAPNPATPGQTVTFTATTSTTGALPTGSVAFLDGGTQISLVPLVSGSAVFLTNSLIAGVHTIQAVYSGDTNYGAQSASVTETIGYSPAIVTLISSANPAAVGQPVTFTAQVAATGPPPSGQVVFQDNGRQIAAVPISSNASAAFTTSSLTVGAHSVTAIYSGDTNYSSQSASLSQTITANPSAATLTASPNPARLGQSVTFVAAIHVLFPTPPTGVVNFYDGIVLLGAAPIDLNGNATFATTALPTGIQTLTAVYAGDATYAAGSSPAFFETIQPNPLDFTIALASSTLSIQTQHHLTTTVTLTSLNNFADSLAITCTNLPPYVTCRPTPVLAALASNGTTTVSLYLDTDSTLGYARGHAGPLAQTPSPIHLALLLSPFGFLASLLLRRRKATRRIGLRLGVLLLATLTMTFALVGCGNDIFPYDIPASVAPGTYTIPITATGNVTGISHTAQLVLTVTP
jgi:hypothetical protein